MLYIPGGEDLQLTSENVSGVSPLHLPPNLGIDYVVAVGERETDEWRRQTDVMVERLRSAGATVTECVSTFDHHYSVLPTLANPTTELGQLAVAPLGGRGR